MHSKYFIFTISFFFKTDFLVAPKDCHPLRPNTWIYIYTIPIMVYELYMTRQY